MVWAVSILVDAAVLDGIAAVMMASGSPAAI